MIKRICVALLCAGSLAFAQLESNTIMVTASRTTNLAPDQVIFVVTLAAPLAATFDDVLAALSGSGITAANVTGASSSVSFCLPGAPSCNPGGVLNAWTFALPVPLAQMKAMIGLFTTLQTGLAQKNNGFSLTYSLSGVQVSAQAQQSQPCVAADLISDAQTQAQKLADAGGLRILGVSGISSVVNSSSGTSTYSYATSSICSMTVKFSVVRGTN